MALVIVTLPAQPGDAPSANLRAPLVIDPARRVLRQLVIADESLSLTATIGL
jgi:flagellar assembly factor FliW